MIEDEGDVDPIELALFDEPAVVDSEGLDEDFVCELKLESAELKIEEAAVDAPLLTAGDEDDWLPEAETSPSAVKADSNLVSSLDEYHGNSLAKVAICEAGKSDNKVVYESSV